MLRDLLGRTKRTLDLKNNQLLSKHQAYETVKHEMNELSSLLAKKQRTIDWKNEILVSMC